MTGTVSGLNGGGLVLSINAVSLPVASGATTVALASGLSQGTAYTVSVQTQPTGETCTVANGMGTIASANVANVVVTCADQSYPLGGTISGLNGSGLVLANGTNQVAVSSDATTFTLPTQVAYGSSYAVTVQTQPAGLACTVSSGSGTMPAAAVTRIAVSCTDQPFTVGGTITGLGTSTGLILVNGPDSLTVAAGSTSFTMPTPVQFGGSYAVSAQSSPTGLTCSVSNGSGTISAAANVTNVAVACSDLSYSLGGSISGLTASGLILSNGTDTLTVASGANHFTMPTPVPFGSAYNVQVATEPTGETCSLSNASNIMPASAVTNVAVACSVSTYTIGGSISGLSASGLVLLDNGGDPTSIAANATQFTMHTGVAYGGSYAITVQAQPSGESCQVSQGTGNISATVTTVAISCAPLPVYTTYTPSVLYSFLGGTGDGSAPNDSLIQGTDGFLYGNTSGGGSNGTGIVFKLSTAGTETLLYSFGTMASLDAIDPFSSMILGADGNLYGTTGNGGQHSVGALFGVTTGGTETVVYSFAGGIGDGSNPNGLMQANDGNFYGTTPSGGANNAGTVYKTTLLGAETLLHSFGGAGDGSSPLARLYQGSDGYLYGTTNTGGTYGAGTVFRMTTAGAETVIYSFGASSTDGNSPQSSLIQASDGNFYGTTRYGGANGAGTVYQVTLAGAETVLYSFGTNANDGLTPFARLFQGNDGNLYGTTPVGGPGGINGYGVVFRVTLAGAETVIHTFSGGSADGAYPQNSLIQGTDGYFYTTTLNGGTSNLGTVFKIVPQ